MAVMPDASTRAQGEDALLTAVAGVNAEVTALDGSGQEAGGHGARLPPRTHGGGQPYDGLPPTLEGTVDVSGAGVAAWSSTASVRSASSRKGGESI